MKKKICIIHKVNVLDGRSFHKQAKSLAKAGCDVLVLGLYERNASEQGIRLEGFKAKSRMYRFIRTNYQIFRRALKESFDVYHFHDLDFVPWALMLKMLTGSKVIYDIHEAHPEYIMIKSYIPRILRRILSRLIYLMEHGAIKAFDAIIPNDNFVSDDFIHERNVTIFNFPTLDFFRGSADTPWEERKYDLFYHGSLPKYHFEAMMSIAGRLNSGGIKNLWGIVSPDPSIVEWAKVEIGKRGLAANFEFLPYTDYMNVSEYLGEAKIGIIPLPPFQKFYKNIPLKMFEFMGCGLPVVLSDLPPSRQFIDGEECAIAVEPNNIDEYAAAIKLLLNNPITSAKMGRNGERLVLEKYNWTNEEKKLLDLYSELTGDSESAGEKKYEINRS